MKRTCAILLALTMCVYGAPYLAAGESAAADTPMYSVEITSFTPGRFVFEALGFGVLVPSDWVEVELSAEQRAQGLAFSAIDSGDPDAFTRGIQLLLSDIEGATLDEYAQTLSADKNVSELEKCIVNGVECLSYRSESSNAVYAVCELGRGQFLTVFVSYANAWNMDADDSLALEVIGSLYRVVEASADTAAYPLVGSYTRLEIAAA